MSGGRERPRLARAALLHCGGFRPLADARHISDGALMRCFYVLVHGRLRWRAERAADPDAFRPQGFYCHRYVLASGVHQARDKAFARVGANLERQTGWISRGAATLDLQADEVVEAGMHKLLKPDNRGHTFYDQE